MKEEKNRIAHLFEEESRCSNYTLFHVWNSFNLVGLKRFKKNRLPPNQPAVSYLHFKSSFIFFSPSQWNEWAENIFGYL